VARKREAEAPEDPTRAIIAEYRVLLSAPAVLPSLRWEPMRLGHTWQTTPDGRWDLPVHTLGWEVLGWCGHWLQHDDETPWRFTPEQARLVLWWYAVDGDGRFLYRDGVLQRLKGWGKDPLGACLCFVEAVGPCRFAGWGDDGEPLAVDNPSAWVQTAAVSLEQTKNTTLLFQTLPTAEAIAHFGAQVGVEVSHFAGGRRIQAVTSSPRTLEGGRATFVLLNETQHWDSSNGGHEMAAVISRNAAKSAGGSARTLRITNAYEPGGDSVGQRDREAYDAVRAGRATDTGLMYDSLEAPPEAPLSAAEAAAVVDAVRGDSHWLDLTRVVAEILDVRNPASTSRRFWYNQIVASEDAWVVPQVWDACADPTHIVPDGCAITLGFDGSRTDDESALVACEVETDHLFALGVWSPGEAGEVDRAAIDAAVRKAFDRWDVVGFFADLHPWESYVDRWAEDLSEHLPARAAPKHAVAWDMASRQKDFTLAAGRFLEAVQDSAQEARDALVEGRPPRRRLTHDGTQRFRQHVHNARRAPNAWGVTIRKEHRESARKIDALPAAILARLARLDYLALPAGRRRQRASHSPGLKGLW